MEQKGQIFFFGRPGCLKQSIPIRVSEEEDEKKNEECADLKEKVELEKLPSTSDDDTDGDELMKRISEVLDDEPDNSQNHNDKSVEKCENNSHVNNNDHEKLVKEENNDNMLSALETLKKNTENVIENSSVNSEEINSNTTEKCGDEVINIKNDESLERDDVCVIESIKENEKGIEEVAGESEEISSTQEGISEVPKFNIPSIIVEEYREEEAMSPTSNETETIESIKLPEKAEEILTNVSPDESDSMNDKSTLSENILEASNLPQELSEIPTSSNECQSHESLNPIDKSSSAAISEIDSSQEKESPLIIETPINDEITEPINESEKSLEPSGFITENTFENESQPVDVSTPLKEQEEVVEEPSEMTESESQPMKDEILSLTKCEESNQIDEEIKDHQELEESLSSQHSKEEIESITEPMETGEIITENTLNNSEMTEEPSITEVLDSNKNEPLENSSESNDIAAMSKSQEIVEDSKPLVEQTSTIESESNETLELRSATNNENFSEMPEVSQKEEEKSNYSDFTREISTEKDNENISNEDDSENSIETFAKSPMEAKPDENETTRQKISSEENIETTEELKCSMKIIPEIEQEPEKLLSENVVENKSEEMKQNDISNVEPDNISKNQPIDDIEESTSECQIEDESAAGTSCQIPQNTEIIETKETETIDTISLNEESKISIKSPLEKTEEISEESNTAVEEPNSLENISEKVSMESERNSEIEPDIHQEIVSEINEESSINLIVEENKSSELTEEIYTPLEDSNEPQTSNFKPEDLSMKVPISNDDEISQNTENLEEEESESIASIEEYKGVEICSPKNEDISIAEEAIPKEEICNEKSSGIIEKSDLPPLLNETIVEPSISQEAAIILECKSEPLTLPQIEVLHTKTSNEDTSNTPSDTKVDEIHENEINIQKYHSENISEEINSPIAHESLEPVEDMTEIDQPKEIPQTIEIEIEKSDEKINDLDKPCTSEESRNVSVTREKSPLNDKEDTTTELEIIIAKKLPPRKSREKVEKQETFPSESNLFDQVKDTENVPITKSQIVTRKRKISENKRLSESDSDGGSHFVADTVSHDPESDVEEEAVQRKKPRIRGKVMTPRRKLPTRHSARVGEANKAAEESPKTEEKPVEESPKTEERPVVNEEVEKDSAANETIQNFKFDYDENEDVVANIAAIKTLICKDQPEKEEVTSDEETPKKKTGRPGRKGKRGRPAASKKVEEQASSSEDEETKSPKLPDSKRTKTSESNEPAQEPVKKKRETKKGLLRDLDTSLVIETIDNEAPVRASRRIAQQKIREETERRMMEEKMLKKMKDEAERKKHSTSVPPEADEKSSGSDESYKGDVKKKKKKKQNPDEKWQTSSSHSEHTETDPEDYEHQHYEDPGSPLFRSDHEFSPESEDDDATPIQPVKRARTAKKQESSDEEDVNPNHACQVCHKTDSPEWILLCDECDCGYHCSCLKPIIFCIPSGNWYCPQCCHKKLITDLGVQLEKLDVLVDRIQVEEIRKQKQIEAQKLTEITERNILNERRNKRGRRSGDKRVARDDQSSENESGSNDNEKSSSEESTDDDAPLIYKLRKRSQATASYRYNDYDELINSAIRHDMEEVKGLGNAGRGKDISTIIEGGSEDEEKQQNDHERSVSGIGEKKMPSDMEKEEDASSGSEVGRSKKSMQKKKKNRKLNALEDTSEEENSDDDFKGSASSNSDTDEEFSASSVSESSLDMPKKKGKIAPRVMRTRTRRREQKFINDNSSDDEPLIKKRNKKKSDSEEEFDLEDDASGSTAEEVDSEDLCDDTDTSSSEGNWPRKKKRVASYDKKPRKPAKKYDEDDEKAFRAGISKKKILEQNKEENESDGSGSDKGKGRRKTRGKKLLYIMEDDFESDDGIKPGAGVVRPETPPEEREMFIKKQEEIKKMLAAKNTEGARKLADPTVEPLNFDIEAPKSPSLPPLIVGSSLSTIPKDVIQGAKALDFDFNRIKPVQSGSQSKVELQPEMSEEELAKMMEEEDFAQHQLKLAGEAIRKQQALLELENKEKASGAFSKTKLKDEKLADIEPKKRARKPKVEKTLNELQLVKAPISEIPKQLPESQSRPMPPHSIPSTQSLHANSSHHHPINMTSAPPPLISNVPHQPQLHAPYSNLPPSRFPHNLNQPLPPHNLQERPSVLSSFLTGHPRPEMHPQAPPMSFHRQMPPEGFIPKGPPNLPPHIQHQASLQQVVPPPTQIVPEEKVKKGRRKKYTPLRQDLPEANVSKVAKLDAPPVDRSTVDDKSKGLPPALQTQPKAMVTVASPPQIFNPGTSPTPSVITRLIQQQTPTQSPQQQRTGPYAGFNEHIGPPPSSSSSQPSATSRAYPSTDEIKHLAAAAAASKQSRPSPQAPFNENPFVPRTMHHTLYRAPPTSQSIYGIPPHARLPYPFHIAPHPNNNLRPNMQDYASSPYGIPPQFAYYGAPPAHSRLPPPNAIGTTNHPISQHHPLPEGVQHPRAGAGGGGEGENSQQTPSEFGGLVSYFSSQQELD